MLRRLLSLYIYTHRSSCSEVASCCGLWAHKAQHKRIHFNIFEEFSPTALTV